MLTDLKTIRFGLVNVQLFRNNVKRDLQIFEPLAQLFALRSQSLFLVYMLQDLGIFLVVFFQNFIFEVFILSLKKLFKWISQL